MRIVVDLVAFEEFRKKRVLLSELEIAFLRSYLGKTRGPVEMFNLLRNIVRISKTSLKLCALYFVFLFHLSIVFTLKFYQRNAFSFLESCKRNLFLPASYYFRLFSFKIRYARLNPVKNHRNILCIVHTLSVGGAQEVMLNIAKGNKGEGFSFHLTTVSSEHDWRSAFEPYFNNIIIVPKTNESFYHKYFEYIIKRLKIDIVIITNSVVGYGCLPRLKSMFENIKIIDLIHEFYEKYDSHVLKNTMFVDRRISISNKFRNRLAATYQKYGYPGICTERLMVIHNGIDAKIYNTGLYAKGVFKNRYSIPQDSKIVSFIGRFSKEKNPLLFVEVAKKVVSRFPTGLKFVMTGYGPEFDRVKELIVKSGVENYFVLTGKTENVTDLLADTDILLVVSKLEGIPLVIMEAMAMGVPVISTDIGGIGELIENNVNGFLINTMRTTDGVTESFSQKIIEIVTGQIDYCAFSEKARNTIIPRFTLKEMASRYLVTFEELI